MSPGIPTTELIPLPGRSEAGSWPLCSFHSESYCSTGFWRREVNIYFQHNFPTTPSRQSHLQGKHWCLRGRRTSAQDTDQKGLGPQCPLKFILALYLPWTFAEKSSMLIFSLQALTLARGCTEDVQWVLGDVQGVRSCKLIIAADDRDLKSFSHFWILLPSSQGPLP